MKKIVGAVLATAMLVGSAFAADISFSYTGSNYFTSSGGNLKYSDRTDCMSLSISNETSGAVVDFDTEDGDLVQDEYYGWMNFGLPVGNLQVTAGVWNGRYVNRVRADAGDLDGADFEYYKPGVINGVVGKDSDNLTQGNISMVAAYTLADTLPGTLMAKFGLVKSTWNPDATSATTAKESGDVVDGDATVSAGFVGEIAYRQDDVINVNLAIRNLVKKNVSIGLFVSPLMVEKLSLTAGFTFATVNLWNKEIKDDWSDQVSGKEFAFDIRARYQITDELSITTMHNISSGLGNYATSANVEKDADDKITKYDGDNTLKIWDMVSVAFKFDERMTIGCTLNAEFDKLDSNHVFTGAKLTTSPYLAIQATEKFAVTTALRVVADGINPRDDGHESFGITVPVIVSFNY